MQFLFYFIKKAGTLNLFFLLFISSLSGQTIIVGSPDKSEEYYRNDQLFGKVDSLVSFCVRPLSYSAVNYEKGMISVESNEKAYCSVMPLRLVQQYNTFAPMGWNDGSMIPAKGYQAQLSPGIKAGYKRFSVQLNPEFVFADNPPFETFPLDVEQKVQFAHIYYLNQIDAPERFGTTNYNKVFWGQSSMRLNFEKLSLGVSTENIWWGPGQRNSLVMSNNAPGFFHFTFNTRRPVRTPIGSFEGQFIMGKLTASGYETPDEVYIVDGVNYKKPKRNDWRYLNGITINYQPKWVPGLFLGLNRVFQVYSENLGHGVSDYLPVITPFQKKYLLGEDAKERDQLASLFVRWVLKKSKAELYFEKGWNDSSADLWDLYESPSHSSAYIFGFTKLFSLRSDKDNYVRLNIENTMMQQSADQMVRNADSWYMHTLIWHGYTHQSQVIGAGIGPGGNSQTIDVSIWKKKNVTGFQLERYAHNLDYFYRAYKHDFDGYYDYNNKWVELNLNTYAYRRFGNIGVQFQFNISCIRNYEWVLKDNEFNFQPKVSLIYHF